MCVLHYCCELSLVYLATNPRDCFIGDLVKEVSFGEES